MNSASTTQIVACSLIASLTQGVPAQDPIQAELMVISGDELPSQPGNPMAFVQIPYADPNDDLVCIVIFSGPEYGLWFNGDSFFQYSSDGLGGGVPPHYVNRTLAGDFAINPQALNMFGVLSQAIYTNNGILVIATHAAPLFPPPGDRPVKQRPSHAARRRAVLAR